MPTSNRKNGATCVLQPDPTITTLVEVLCTPGESPATTTTTLSGSVWTEGIWAKQIQFIFQTDLSPAITVSGSATSDATPPATDSSSKSPLPKGAIAGIAVGFAILLLIALCTPVWILHRRKQRQHSSTGTKKRIPFDISSLPELIGIKGNGGSSAEMRMGHPNDVVPRGGGVGTSSTPIAR